MNEEHRLIEDARNGSATAFTVLIRLHQARVRGYLFRYARTEEIVEDLAQETFLRAYRDLSYYKGESAFAVWLLGIARHRALDSLREEEVRRAAQGRLLDSAVARWRAAEASREEGDLDRELGALRECVSKLPADKSRLVADHYFGSRSLAEIAREAGKTEGALKMILFRVREILRECVERRSAPGEALS